MSEENINNKEAENENLVNESELSEEELLLKKKQEELDDITDRYKRVFAEFENYKKRSSKERETLYGSILSDIVAPLLPVIDNLEKAVQTETEDENYKQGVELVLKQFKDVLTSQGVEEINSVGEIFDPELHEAVSSVVDESLGEKVIKEDYRKGYKIGNKVIRHSMVVVAN